MHFSRMHTARFSGCLLGDCTGGGSAWRYLPGEGECLPWGYLPRGGGSATPLWTDACENITLPQNSFAGGKNVLGIAGCS